MELVLRNGDVGQHQHREHQHGEDAQRGADAPEPPGAEIRAVMWGGAGWQTHGTCEEGATIAEPELLAHRTMEIMPQDTP